MENRTMIQEYSAVISFERTSKAMENLIPEKIQGVVGEITNIGDKSLILYDSDGVKVVGVGETAIYQNDNKKHLEIITKNAGVKYRITFGVVGYGVSKEWAREYSTSMME